MNRIPDHQRSKKAITIRIAAWLLGIVVVLGITGYIAFQVSPWPSVFLIRRAFDKDAIRVASYALAMGIEPSIERSQLRGVILHCGAYDTKRINLDGPFGGFLNTVLWSTAGGRILGPIRGSPRPP
ncbi:MAG: hypothetical protein ACREOO_16410 [bacterium]